MVYQEDEISFVRAQDYCVCFVDIVDSTRVTSSINNPDTCCTIIQVHVVLDLFRDIFHDIWSK